MTPERFVYLVEHCQRLKRRRGSSAPWREIARFFKVREITVRRWRSGEARIPRAVAIVLEIFHEWPEVTAEGVEEVLRRRDEAAKARSLGVNP